MLEADLWPWHLPHSQFVPDPWPLLTLWGGPIFGIAVPCGVALIVRRNWMWLIANFCVLANGVYLALAWISGEHLLDTARLLEAGTWPVSIAAYCFLAIGLGYWHFRRCRGALAQPQQNQRRQNRTLKSSLTDSAKRIKVLTYVGR